MQILFLWMLLAATLLAQDKYSIQVLSVENKVSITQDFMQTVKQTGMAYTQTMSDGKYRVYLGAFSSKEDARKALKGIQREVSKDAFVCKVEGPVPVLMEPKEKMQHAMLMAKARSLKIVKKDESELEIKELNSMEPIEIEGPAQKTNITKADSKRVMPMEKEVKREKISSKGTSKKLFCKSTKSSLREHEISTALSFYKNSSYYTFSN